MKEYLVLNLVKDLVQKNIPCDRKYLILASFDGSISLEQGGRRLQKADVFVQKWESRAF